MKLDDWALRELPLLDCATPDQVHRAMREWSLELKRRDRELHEILTAILEQVSGRW